VVAKTIGWRPLIRQRRWRLHQCHAIRIRDAKVNGVALSRQFSELVVGKQSQVRSRPESTLVNPATAFHRSLSFLERRFGAHWIEAISPGLKFPGNKIAAVAVVAIFYVCLVFPVTRRILAGLILVGFNFERPN